MTKEKMTKVLVEMLSKYRRYYAELMYWETQYNFPEDDDMREHAQKYHVSLYKEAMEELKKVHDEFDYKYEDTDDEDIAYSIDFGKVVKSVNSEACEIAETMRKANGIYIQ